jgi:LuxR family quorum-sensing system transcriptional regulator CciR
MRDVLHFIDRFQQAIDGERLRETLEDLTRHLGFERFAMGHHVDLTRPPEDAIRLTNYRRDWTERALDKGYFVDDPIHFASTRTVVGFQWRDVAKMIDLTDRQRHILRQGQRFGGLAAGFTVPVHQPGEYRGTCSFGTSSAKMVRRRALPFAQLGGAFAFEAARKIMLRNSGREPKGPPSLTPRQQEALVLIGRGKTDGEIGTIMGVSRATAHEHVEGVRRAYGNAQRAYLVVRALFDGQISFTDLLRR